MSNLFIPTDIFNEIASFHCHLPQDQRDTLAAQPHIQQLKTMTKTVSYDYYNDHNRVVKWTIPDAVVSWKFDLYIRTVFSREGVMLSEEDNGEETFYIPAVYTNRYNFQRWSDGHFHFGYEPTVDNRWLTKCGMALICTDQPTQEQIGLAQWYATHLVKRILKGSTPKQILKNIIYLNANKLKNCIIMVFNEDSWDDDYCYKTNTSGWKSIFETNHKAFLKYLMKGETFVTQ